ncbi:hypothetical protein [Paenibacillus popilliae]|uniref:ATPase n=1 Tax=Paenibacillus popilliae ATCC 14706 TaxID=1212764 RepID=M9M2Z4_PAEPP|nr:hypothetical protein [Paenibacillus popilliae]GAC41553.1 ATPase [Paenibacillus popilliae ATCC 14706]
MRRFKKMIILTSIVTSMTVMSQSAFATLSTPTTEDITQCYGTAKLSEDSSTPLVRNHRGATGDCPKGWDHVGWCKDEDRVLADKNDPAGGYYTVKYKSCRKGKKTDCYWYDSVYHDA